MRFDVMFVHLECFPFLPAAFEHSLLPKSIPCVYDYDDAWFHRYDQHPNRAVRILLGHKIGRLIEQASGVIAGSGYVANYASQFNGNVHIIPTSIDLARYPAAPPPLRSDTPFTIGWIGSPSTTVFLKEVAEPLAEFLSTHRARVVLIGPSPASLSIPNLTCLPWTEGTEVEEMSRFDVGIMPLTDTPFTRGKCAFKLIQYMGCWKPVIASPVGENVKVVKDGVNGFLANSPSEWIAALHHLYADVTLRQVMGKAGRAKIEREYSLHVTAPRVTEILRLAAEKGA